MAVDGLQFQSKDVLLQNICYMLIMLELEQVCNVHFGVLTFSRREGGRKESSHKINFRIYINAIQLL